ncbi:DUF2330 domain-containing protein [Streptomyces sp. NPDC003635]
MGFLRLRVGAVAFALLVTQVGSAACAAVLPGPGQRVAVQREEALVRWDGRREQIVLRMTLAGDAERAAWIMPVPNRATVRLGDPELFEALHSVTAPVTRVRHHFWPHDDDWPLTTGDRRHRHGPPPGARHRHPVGVVGRQRLGPFDVARLTATDPEALDGWLDTNGFTLPPRMAAALRPYVDRHWEYVAVRLTPESAGDRLTGALDPLHVTFASTGPVYPMRLSGLAETPQSLGLYVLAAHRMEPASRIGGARPRVTYAGRVNATSGPLTELAAGGTPYLTAIGQEFPRPRSITGDHELRRASTDETFQQVIYEDRLREWAGLPAWLLTIGGTLAVGVTAVSTFLVRRSRRPVGDYIP